MKKKNIGLIILLVLGIFFVIELLSGLVIFSAHHFLGTPKRISVFRFHPLFTRQNILRYDFNWSEDMPVLGNTPRIYVSPECGLTTDKYGFVHNGDPYRELKSERYTIFILGGSSVAGHGTSCNDKTISGQLEQLLRKNYPQVDVVNAAVPGYHSPQELDKLIHDVMFYDPDMIIMFGGINDFVYKPVPSEGRRNTYFISDQLATEYETLKKIDSLPWSIANLFHNLFSFTEYTYTRFVIQEGVEFLTGQRGVTWKGNLVGNIKTETHTRNLPEVLPAYQDEGFEKELRKRVGLYTKYIKMTRALTTGMGVRFQYVVQPVFFIDPKAPSDEEILARKIARYAYYRKYGFDVIKRAKFYWDDLKIRLNKEHVPYRDMQRIFVGHDKVYIDHLHYSDQGVKIIAENLYRMIKEENIPEFVGLVK